MTQQFTLREPESDLAQRTMMPPWKQSDVARFNLEGERGAPLEKPGQKRRRSFTLPTGLDHQFPVYHESLPNERASTDSSSVMLNEFAAPGWQLLHDSAEQPLSLPEERRGHYARVLESAGYGAFAFRTAEPAAAHNVTGPALNSGVFLGADHAPCSLGRAQDPFGHAAAAIRYGHHHRPSLDSAAAATAQAMANFQALVDQGRSTSVGFQAYNNGSSYGSQCHNVAAPTSLLSPEFAHLRGNESGFTPSFPSGGVHGQHQFSSSNHGSSFSLNPSFGLPPTPTPTTGSGFNSYFGSDGDPGGFHDANSSASHQFGDYFYGAANGANSQTPRATAVYAAANSEAAIWPSLACQTGASARKSAPPFPDPQSPCTPRGNQTFNAVLTEAQEGYLHELERLNSEAQVGPDSPRRSCGQSRRLTYSNLFGAPFEERGDASQAAEKQPQHLHVYFDESGMPERVCVEESADVATVQVGESAAENFSHGVEPLVGGGNQSARGAGDQFDLNEVPGAPAGAAGDAATPPKPRKKYHPRVAKDKRTYKRKSDAKRAPGSGAHGLADAEPGAQKAWKKRSPQYDSTHEECRDTGSHDVVDMDIEDAATGATVGATPHSSAPHNSAVCDCEACIRLRLERRSSASGTNLEGLGPAFAEAMNRSPVSPIARESDPWDHSDSPSVRRTLFRTPPQSACNRAGDGEALAAPTRASWPSFASQPSTAMVLSQSHSHSHADLGSFASSARVPSSCLRHFNESATRLGLSWTTKPVGAAYDWIPNPTRLMVPGQAASTDSPFTSRLCPRGILAPQKIPFREMNQVQRVLYLKSMLSSNLQLTMSPESLLRHVHDHLPEDEKELFRLSLWPIVLKPLTDEQMKQLQEYASSSEQSVAAGAAGAAGAAAVEVVRRKPGPKPKKQQAAKTELAMTLWPDLVRESAQQKPNPKPKGRKSKSGVPTGLEMVPYEGSNGEKSLVPYEDKPVVPYEGPFNPLRRRKPRPKVVLDGETVRVWKLLMGKTAGDATDGAERERATETDADAANRVKWEGERRKMKAQALLFIERMHIVQGDRSFSCWKGSVVDSVVGAFLTQNVNDVLSSSAFMSMRSRFPGRGFRNAQSLTPDAPDDSVAQSFDNPPSPAPTDNVSPDLPPPKNLTPKATTTTTTRTVLESQESRNEEHDDRVHTPTGQQPLAPSPEANSNTPWQNQNREESAASTISSAVSEVINQEESNSAAVAPQSGSPTDAGSEMGRGSGDGYNAKTGLTGLERAKIEEKQVTARKSFDFAGLQEAFRPRVRGAPRPPRSPRTPATEDGVDWEAVRRADVREVADVIKERGLNWILAGRIKAFLERIHLDYGSLDLEWLRSMSTDQTKEFLLSIRGLGLKSVECIRLLTLHHLAFPVDTNVGRICVRLGWVPLEPLPEELQLHLLELYPVQATIQKYLWPRLCKLDQQTLYELHYQMITFGKVFCTKSKPNCNACPMRPECKHFASALSSAKLALPASERPNSGPTLALPGPAPGADLYPGESTPMPEPQGPRPVSQYYCQPIVEEPMTPESEAEMEDFDIEDYPFSIEEVEDDAVMDICIQNQVLHSQSIHNSQYYSCATTLPQPSPKPISEPFFESLPRPVSEYVSKPISEPFFESLPRPVSEYVSKPISEPFFESLPRPVLECVSKPISEPFFESLPRPVSEYVSKPISEPFFESLSRPVSEYVSKPISEHVSKSTSRYVVEPISRPMSRPILDPTQGPFSMIVSEPGEESDTTIMEDWGGLATSARNSVQLGANFEGVSCTKNAIEITESVCEEVLDVGSNNCSVEETMASGEVLIHSSAKSSHQMVLVAPGATSIPVPKLKNVGRLRTVHYVYELPDNHPLLDGLDPKEEDDPCTYLLAIWSPGEVPESIPNMNDRVDEENPFATPSSEGEETIKATLLVPCRTAMRGTFPLNGTYFQVNEVFADHASSLQPMIVPRTLLWNLRRRFVFFGTSVTSIFRGMTVEEIQACFWRGYVCVRGFDRTTRAPKPLVGRLHLQAGKSSGKGASAES